MPSNPIHRFLPSARSYVRPLHFPPPPPSFNTTTILPHNQPTPLRTCVCPCFPLARFLPPKNLNSTTSFLSYLPYLTLPYLPYLTLPTQNRRTNQSRHFIPRHELARRAACLLVCLDVLYVCMYVCMYVCFVLLACFLQSSLCMSGSVGRIGTLILILFWLAGWLAGLAWLACWLGLRDRRVALVGLGLGRSLVGM